MGNLPTKVGEEDVAIATPGSIPTTPILTPKHRNNDDFDPRSPSSNIHRTPIQMLLTPKSKPVSPALENLDENTYDTFNINSPMPAGLIDPRSPSVDFTRTPIIVSEIKGLPHKLYNKNFDNVRKTLLAITPRKISDIPSHVPPKLLGSSPLTLKPVDANKRKSFIGMLETNLDFIETNLDDVIQHKMPEKETASPNLTTNLSPNSTPNLTPNLSPNSSPKSSELRAKFLENISAKTTIDVLQSKNIDPRSPTCDFMRTPLQILKKVGEIDLNVDEGVTEIEDIVIDDDGLIINPKDVVNSTEVETTMNPIDTTIADQVLATKNNILTPKITHKPLTNISDFDKKLSTLIYTDKEAHVPKAVMKGGKENRDRTPLGTRNGEPKKSISKLKVSDKPRKSEYACSKIPVFNEKKRGLSVQCENTPPRNMNVNKVGKRAAQWDGDNTLII